MMGLIAIAAAFITPYDPIKQNMNVVLQRPGGGYVLGIDGLGRDVLSRLILGARTSVSVGLFTQMIVLAIGMSIGAMAAFAGGRVGNLLMRFTDIMYAFPHLVLFPGIAIALLMLSFTFLGDGLRDALDPHMRGNKR